MRHRKKINHLGRTSSHRKAMLANMASSLIIHKRISTTTAKAKALRIYVEPLLNKSKVDTTHSRRIVFSFLKNKEAVTELFRDIAQKIAARPGGYTRILKTGNRLGDNADMCIIELVDYNENMLAAKAESKAPAKRSRRGKKKSEDEVKPSMAVKKDASADVAEVVAVEEISEVIDEVIEQPESKEKNVVAEEIFEKPVEEKKAKKPVAKKKEASKDVPKDTESEKESE